MGDSQAEPDWSELERNLALQVRRVTVRSSSAYWIATITAIIAGVLVALLVSAFVDAVRASQSGQSHWPSAALWWWILLGVGVPAVASLAFYVFRTAQTRATLAKAELLKGELEERQLEQLKTVMPLATLLKLNQRQIDAYHEIATKQADQSFRSSQRAMGVGLLIIAGCVFAGMYVQSGDAKVFLGAVAAIGAALSGYLNRTYLNMYAQTLEQLNRFFEQPVLTGYYLTAERLAEGIDDGNPSGEVRRQIVAQVLAASAQMSKAPTAGKVPTPRRSRKSSTPVPAGDVDSVTSDVAQG